jgi:type IV secretion system protein TrbI
MADKDQNQAKFSLRGAKPKSSELNKKLIAVVGAILGTAIVLAFLFSINTGPTQRTSSGGGIKATDVDQKTDTAGVDGLPGGYQDNTQINKLMGLNKKPEVIEKIPSALQSQLEQMKSQQSQLQSELSRLRSQKTTSDAPIPKPTPQPMSLMDREAMSASIFFPGGAPRPISPKPKDIDKDGKTVASSKDGKTAQDEKLAFMDGKVNKDVTNQNTIQKPISKYTVFAGSVIPGILKTRLVSNTPGSIVAIVSQDVYDSVTGRYLLIPKGSTLLGTYNSKVSYGDYQLQAKFIRLIRPDGTSIILPNQIGVDGMGVSGFSDELDNHWGQLIAAAALTTVFSIPAVAAQYSQNQAQQWNGSGYNSPSTSSTITNSALQGAGETVSKIGGKVTERAMNIQPTITIHEGYRFSILVTKDIILPPYSRTASL